MTSLILNNISFALPHLSQPIINNVSYLIGPGEFIILLGSNGSGKSTLLKLLSKQYLPTQGEILIDHQPLKYLSAKRFSQRIKILTQNPDASLFSTLTVYENYLVLKRKNHPSQRPFLQTYLAPFNQNLAGKLDVLVSHLSGGEKQSLALAYAVLNKPDLLLLDEHTSALDPKTATDIMRLTHESVRENKITCLLTTHDLNIALQYGDRILMLANGKIKQTFERDAKQFLSRQALLNYY